MTQGDVKRESQIERQGGISLVQVMIGLILLLVVGAGLVVGFNYLSANSEPKALIAIVAIIWGVGGAAALFWVFNYIVEGLPDNWTRLLQPYVFVGPAVLLLLWFLALPVYRTFWLSLFDRNGFPAGFSVFRPWTWIAGLQNSSFIGFSNYGAIFTERLMREAFRNNVMWIVFGATFSVLFGLLIAVLADRSKADRAAKSFVFLPMAISFVGAGVIWKFIYEIRPANIPQIGLLNAIIVGLGGSPKAWYAWTDIIPWNNLFLIVIVIWLQTGFAMVLFSAAIKGIPNDLIEAGRVDGANETQIFFRIMVPSIMGTIITVTTTVVIFTLKIFDVVWVMSGGQFSTEVIATQFFRQSFVARNSGYGSAIAFILLIAVIPVMIYNLRQFREKEAF